MFGFFEADIAIGGVLLGTADIITIIAALDLGQLRPGQTFGEEGSQCGVDLLSEMLLEALPWSGGLGFLSHFLPEFVAPKPAVAFDRDDKLQNFLFLLSRVGQTGGAVALGSRRLRFRLTVFKWGTD